MTDEAKQFALDKMRELENEFGADGIMEIKVIDISNHYQVWFVEKIDSILTGKHHYKMLIRDINEPLF
ncbi:hypothetical protein BH23PAT2_BH23PAT2_07630 [soil metagenome]